MLKLNYIIIDDLPKQEQQYLEENLKKEKAEENGCRIVRWAVKEIGTIEEIRDKSIFISANTEHLKAVAKYGIATVGYLMQYCACDNRKEFENPEGEQSKTYYDEFESSKEKDELVDNISCVKDQDFCADMYAEGLEEVGFTFLNRVFERHHHIPWIILETERCIVRELSLDDLDALFVLYAWDGMTDYMEPLYDYEQEKEYQKAYIEHMYGFYGYGMWLVIEKETGRLIGRIGIEHREELGGELELGYAIGTPYQRKGYAIEVCTAVLAYSKKEFDISQINCLIEEGNTVSEHLARKLGFSPRGRVEVSGKQMKKYIRLFI